MTTRIPDRDEPEVVFAQLNGLLRLVGLYPTGHPQIRRAQTAFLDVLGASLARHEMLEFRFIGDLLIAGNRILARESLMYRRFLEVCQAERRIGTIVFRRGVTVAELESLVEVLATGSGDVPAKWAARQNVPYITLEPPTKREEQTSEAMARRAYFGAVEMLRAVEAGILRQEPITLEHLSSLRVLTSTILEQILSDPSLVLRLANIKSYDEYLLYHSVNVSVLAIGMGVAVELSQADLRELAVAAILHDLGKITVPLEILHKAGPLSEYEWHVMRKYPVRGADMLSRLPGFNRIPMLVAYEHQIRHDRLGYPSVSGTWIRHPFSEIVGLADAYDSMTTLRPHKRAMPASRALETLREESGKAYDPTLVRVLERVVRTPQPVA